MNSEEFWQALQDCTARKATAVSFYVTDKIPAAFTMLPAVCIADKHPSNLLGEHWTGIFQEFDESMEFFEFFGRSPQYYGLDLDLLNNKRIIMKENSMQSELTTVCKQYRLFFVGKRCSGITFHQIVGCFMGNQVYNNIEV